MALQPAVVRAGARLTDVIRPFTEKRGLRADQIRLQREEVAIEIAKRAHQRLTIPGTKIKPIPNKGLVTFFEKSGSVGRFLQKDLRKSGHGMRVMSDVTNPFG